MTSMSSDQASKRAAASGQAPGLHNTFNQDTFDLLARALCATPEGLAGLAGLARTGKPLAAFVAASAVWEELYRAVALCNASKYLKGAGIDRTNISYRAFSDERGLHAAFSHAAVAPRARSPACWRRACEMLLSKACKGCGAMCSRGEPAAPTRTPRAA